VGGRAVLYGAEGAEVASFGREQGEAVAAGLAALAAVVRQGDVPDTGHGRRPFKGAGRDTVRLRRVGATSHIEPAPARAPQPPELSPRTPASATDTLNGAHLAAYALGPTHTFTLGVATQHRAPGNHTIASVAAVLLSLLTGEQRSGTDAARISALVRLLLGARPEEVASLIGGGDTWLVLHARPTDDGPPPDALSAATLGAAAGSALVDAHGDTVRVLVPADHEITAQPGWTCGVSAPAAPHAWASADTQAARALARARATRTALVRHGTRTALAELIPAHDATAHARALLAPLADSPALAETLRTWLSLHGSWDRTAVALAVHRNTVRQRIGRCAVLLEADLDDPDVRMELWFALRER
jgi:hypothetical protein